MTTPVADTRRLRVLHVYRTYFPDTQGGAEELIQQVCLNTREHGIENRVFSLSRQPDPAVLVRPEAELHRAKLHIEVASCGISFSAWRAFREQVRWADVVHYYFPWPFGDVLHLMSGAWRKPTLVTFLSDVVRQRWLNIAYTPLRKGFFHHVDRVVATSPNHVQSSPLLRTYLDRVEVIPIGIDLDAYPQPDTQRVAALRRELGDSFLLFVGVLRYYKGLHVLLEAARHNDVDIVIAGSGPEEQSLKQQARRLGLSRVRFVGRVDDKEKVALLSACRGMVFPSHLPSESFGVSLLEAAMMGKPMISCEVGTGTSYVNLHDETGLVVPPSDAEALHRAMLEVAHRPEQAERWGLAAHQRFEALFTGATMGRQYAALYRELCPGLVPRPA